LTLARGPLAGAITIPAGTRLIAQTPAGERIFETLAQVTAAEGAEPGQVWVQATVAGRGGEVITMEGITWRVDERETALAGLEITQTEPILSLVTLCYDVIFKQIEALHPQKLIAEPLNEIYQEIVKMLEELGLTKIFDVLFEKFATIEREIKEGLGRTATALGGVLTAMPV
jgi:hypothetical protein